MYKEQVDMKPNLQEKDFDIEANLEVDCSLPKTWTSRIIM